LKIAPTVPAADGGVEAKIAILKKGRSGLGQWTENRHKTYFELLNTITQPIVPMIKAGKLSLQYVSGASVNGSIAEAVIRRAPPKRIMYLWSK